MRETAKFEQLRKKALARFKGHNEPGKTIVLFCHHEKFAEVLSEPIENRIDYIINEKPEGEIETRLCWIQPYKGHSKMKKADAEWEKAYEPIFMAEHSDCPWDGKTLFPKKKESVGLRP